MKATRIITGIFISILIAPASTALGSGILEDGARLEGLQIDQPPVLLTTTANDQRQQQQQPAIMAANESSQLTRSTRLVDRIKRQIPFISKWLSGITDDGETYRKKISSSYSSGSGSSSSSNSYRDHNSKGYVSTGSIIAQPGPPPLNTTDRDGRFLSLFTVVRFDNTECLTQSGDNGTCYPSAECYRRGGSPNGKCAQGYGSCCIFSKSCGASTNQNCTYFTHNGYPTSFDGTGSCQLTVYKSAPDVCQLRLDFDSFNVAQPGTNGICNNDQFIISGSTSAIPITCGINSGNHMYIDVGRDNSPVTLSVITSGPTYSRSWKIKITQVRCHSLSRAPEGCLQYHQSVSGVIRSYNFDFATGQQLSNQDWSTCIRMERNFCGIRYTACTDTEVLGNTQNQQNQRSRAFSLTGQATQGQTVGAQVSSQSCQTDWITIPCATNSGRTTQLGGTVCQDRICGDVFNSEQSQTQMPVFSYSKPFRLTYHTDSNETNDVGNRGFCLNYIQQPCTPTQK